MSSLAAWGPTLVLAITVLSAGAVGLRFAGGVRSVKNGHALIADKGSSSLSAALREAEAINAYRIGLPGDPRVHLGPVARITPARYQDAVNEIPRHFSEGHVVSIDLGRMSASQAARLVDFAAATLWEHRVGCSEPLTE